MSDKPQRPSAEDSKGDSEETPDAMGPGADAQRAEDHNRAIPHVPPPGPMETTTSRPEGDQEADGGRRITE